MSRYLVDVTWHLVEFDSTQVEVEAGSREIAQSEAMRVIKERFPGRRIMVNTPNCSKLPNLPEAAE
jgi:hypothetical protein